RAPRCARDSFPSPPPARDRGCSKRPTMPPRSAREFRCSCRSRLKVFLQPVKRLLEKVAPLAKSEAYEMAGFAIFKKRTQRNKRDARFFHKPPAKNVVAFVGEFSNPRSKKIGALSRQQLECTAR